MALEIIKNTLHLICSAFFRFFVLQISKKKYYFIDQGILNLFLIGQDSKLLENIVFLHLYRKSKHNLFYFKRKLEVDFYIANTNLLYQVCYSLANIETKQREIASLNAAMNELGIYNATIVTYDEEETIILDSKQIDVVPVWKFLLLNSTCMVFNTVNQYSKSQIINRNQSAPSLNQPQPH